MASEGPGAEGDLAQNQVIIFCFYNAVIKFLESYLKGIYEGRF
jgi:hypothetical protein